MRNVSGWVAIGVALSGCQQTSVSAAVEPSFLVVGGGGSPQQNEISLEKNVLYFQRTLKTLGFDPARATIYFANGKDGRATVRYLDGQRQQRFKVPQIPNLKGASTPANVQGWFQQTAQQRSTRPIFFYFTGHGGHDSTYENNSLLLWGNRTMTVQQFTAMLDRLPTQTPVVSMMAQCYSGSFANLIYQGGIPGNPVAPHNRCGFFATVKELPSVGCTPEVNEADYEDYSSSFFAGLSGRTRAGKSIPLPDYNRDRRVSFAEAHAFAKLDDHSMDLPVSTSEVWLQRQATDADGQAADNQAIGALAKAARPEQASVITALSKFLRLNMAGSLAQNLRKLRGAGIDRESTYVRRLQMELVNVVVERRLRTSQNPTVSTLSRIQRCEAGSLNSR